MYPSAFISPFPHSPILLAVLPLSSRIPSLPSCLLVPPAEPLLPHSPPLWQSARPSSCTPHSFCWPSPQLASIIPVSSFPSWWTPTVPSTLPAEAPLCLLSAPRFETPSHLHLEEAGAVTTGMIPLQQHSPAPGLHRHALLAHLLEQRGHEHRAGSPVGCSAPEARVCWWMGRKVFRKLNNLKQRWVWQEHALMSSSLVTTDPIPEHDVAAALHQKAGGFIFFPLSNVGKTTFLLSSPLVFLGNGWIGLADNIKINLPWERDTTWKSQIKW